MDISYNIDLLSGHSHDSGKQKTMTHCKLNVGPLSATLAPTLNKTVRQRVLTGTAR